MSRAQASDLVVSVPESKVYNWGINGKQIRLLLAVLDSASFRGSQVFIAADTIASLQKLVLEDAHGPEPTEGG